MLVSICICGIASVRWRICLYFSFVLKHKSYVEWIKIVTTHTQKEVLRWVLNKHRTFPECGRFPGSHCITLTVVVINNHLDTWSPSGMRCCPSLGGWGTRHHLHTSLSALLAVLASCSDYNRRSHSWACGLIFVTIKARLDTKVIRNEFSDLNFSGTLPGRETGAGGTVLEAEMVTLYVALTLNLSLREPSEHLARTSC